MAVRRSLVIGHRGASGYRPEHTLAAYELAAVMGADFVEADLVPTRDGVLVCRHDPEIGRTTDVADHPEFADRRRTLQLEGVPVTGWFTHDFTLAELKTLRAKERLPDVRPGNTSWDGRFPVPTFLEFLDLCRNLSLRLGREIGLYLETKLPAYFTELGLAVQQPLLEGLRRHGLDDPHALVFVQSFDTAHLRQLRLAGLRVGLIQLLSATGSRHRHAGPVAPADLATVATYAQGIGPDKNLVIPRKPDGTLGRPTALVDAAQDAGLLVHPYTFRAENTFLPKDYRIGAPPVPGAHGPAVDEQVAYLETGIDGLFTDQPDIGVQAREQYLAERASREARAGQADDVAAPAGGTTGAVDPRITSTVASST